ncbi:hypothetical protein EI94DRAFT_1748330 [Lactarius quietus]|nr:hypothetical protein EI94DRAFT_1748330 [Lactarius quietus]
MKFASFLTLASLAVSAAFAQTIKIGYPHHHTHIIPGKNLTVQVERPDTLTPSQDVAIPSDVLGTTLYAGPYNPQFPTFQTPHNDPQQNFTVTVPSSFKAHHMAQLAVSHLTLVGAGPAPLFEIKHVTLKVVE